MRTPVAIIGGSGLVGKYLMREWPSDQVLGFSSHDVDIRDSAKVDRLVSDCRPEWIILAAAYTDVDGCELNPQRATLTNYQGALHVAEAADRYGSKLLFLSSDYVFDGEKNTPYGVDDPRNPQCEYGRGKAMAEVRIQQVMPAACIVRTSWVFGIGGKCFPNTILGLAASGKELEVVDDQRGSPTYARDLARAIVELCRRQASGIVHVTNSGDCTWFEFASQMIRRAGLSTIIRPTTSDKFVRPAQRPKYSVLSSRSLSQWGIQMPSWQQALEDYMKERAAG